MVSKQMAAFIGSHPHPTRRSKPTRNDMRRATYKPVVFVDNLQRKVYNRRKPKQEHIVRKNRLAVMIGMLFPAIQGQPQSLVMNGAAVDQIGLINALLNVNPWPATAYNAASNTTGFTATQQQIMPAELGVLELTGTIGSGQALTLPTVATLISTLTPQQAVVGSSIALRVGRGATGAFNWTVTTNTGWTLNGTMTIAQSTFRDFIITLTNVGTTPTAVIQQVGTGTWS